MGKPHTLVSCSQACSTVSLFNCTSFNARKSVFICAEEHTRRETTSSIMKRLLERLPCSTKGAYHGNRFLAMQHKGGIPRPCSTKGAYHGNRFLFEIHVVEGPANTMWRKLLYSEDSRRVLAPAPKVLGPKRISNPDFSCKPF